VLESSLTITPTGAVHSLKDSQLQAIEHRRRRPMAACRGPDRAEARPDVEAGGALTLGDEHFKLAIGSHAWQGINLGVESKYGGDLTIVQNLDCNAVAQSVEARCVSELVRGHASDLLAVCQARRDVARHSAARRALADLDRFVAPRAGHRDAGRRRSQWVAEQIQGTWDAQVDLGTGANSMQIAFTAFD